ncbi:MAG: sulfur carrier protein ThiS [Synergistaceae bacterium]|jgi:sulfur carrier protein|nr:sulfur carrier protein ThiS [Synergistaceae bacterium]
MIMVNGDEFEWREGLTVQDILDAKNFTFRMISVWINGEAVQNRADYASSLVPDGGEVEIIHMISGG